MPAILPTVIGVPIVGIPTPRQGTPIAQDIAQGGPRFALMHLNAHEGLDVSTHLAHDPSHAAKGMDGITALGLPEFLHKAPINQFHAGLHAWRQKLTIIGQALTLQDPDPQPIMALLTRDAWGLLDTRAFPQPLTHAKLHHHPDLPEDKYWLLGWHREALSAHALLPVLARLRADLAYFAQAHAIDLAPHVKVL